MVLLEYYKTMMKDSNYYNKESLVYSKKRYPKRATYFVHFLFKKRLQILIESIQSVIKKRKGLSLLEIGCADGIVSVEIGNNIEVFDKIIGIDISTKMIEVANNNKNEKIKFLVRDKITNFNKKFDIIIEIGVLNLVNLSSEFAFVMDNLADEGFYICSIAAKTSTLNKLKPGGENDFKHFLTFKEYEREIEKSFLIIKSVSYGLFIPYIWKIPVFRYFLQVFIEKIFKNITPNLFHEKIYILKKI